MSTDMATFAELKFSEESDKVLPAYLDVLQYIGNVKTSSKNQHQNNTYTELDALLDHVRPILLKYKLTLVQIPKVNITEDETGLPKAFIILAARLYHNASLQWVEIDLPTIVVGQRDKNNNVLNSHFIQSIGSSQTYLRRYTITTLLGIAETDHDGRTAAPADSEVSDEDATPPAPPPDGPPVKGTVPKEDPHPKAEAPKKGTPAEYRDKVFNELVDCRSVGDVVKVQEAHKRNLDALEKRDPEIHREIKLEIARVSNSLLTG